MTGGDRSKNSDPAEQRRRSMNSPWRRGPHCPTPAAKLAHLRYRKEGARMNRAKETK